MSLQEILGDLVASEPFERMLLERARPIVARAEAGQDFVIAGVATALESPVLAVTAALALTGSLAAGASALTSTAQAPTRATDTSSHVVKQGRRHGLCNKGEHHRRSSARALSY